MTFHFHSIFAIAATVALLASGCYYSDCPVQYSGQYRGRGYVEVDTAPPAPHAEVEARPAKPSASAEWVPGHWDWRDDWVWVDGHWETPRPGHVWEPPVARRTPEGRVEYHPGHFRPRDRRPPPVYREPSEVRVSAGRPAAHAGTVVTGETREPTPDATPEVRPGGTVHGGTVETREPTPEVEVRPGGTVEGGSPGTVRPRPGEVHGPGAETARPRPGGTVQGGSPETVQLGCQLTITRAPRGGSVTIRGTGFQRSAVVKVGGTIATVIRTSSDRISFQVPRETGGGTVSVSVGDQTASCGHLSVTGR